MKVILLLGPYRNLTTMIGGYLNFHPEIIVFNHGYLRILDAKADFWNRLSVESYQTFINFVTKNYSGGARGEFGGNIALSHAYDQTNPIHNQLNDIPKKENPKYILLKESGLITNDLRNYHEFGDKLSYLKINKLIKLLGDQIIFIRPIRNIIKCIYSNMRTNHHIYYDFLCKNKKKMEKELFEWYFKDLNWFHNNKIKHPNKFHHFYQKDIKESLIGLIEKLGLVDCQNFKNIVNQLVITDLQNNINNEKLKKKKLDALERLFNKNQIHKNLYDEIILKDVFIEV